jgi:hypothetical protein
VGMSSVSMTLIADSCSWVGQPGRDEAHASASAMMVRADDEAVTTT